MCCRCYARGRPEKDENKTPLKNNSGENKTGNKNTNNSKVIEGEE